MAAAMYSLDCDCGAQVSVTAAMAGTSRPCPCGRQLQVPGLGQLRRMAGQEAYVTNALERVNRAINTGQLPGESCVGCGVITADEIRCHVVCEKRFVRHEDSLNETDSFDVSRWFAVRMFGLLGLFIPSRPQRHVRVLGQDKEAYPIVRVCPSCRGMYGNPRRAGVLKKLLGQVPLYAEMLEEFPEAKVRLLKEAECP